MVVKYGVVSAKTTSRDETSSYQDDDEGGNPLNFPGGKGGTADPESGSAANTDQGEASDGGSSTGGNTESGSSQGGGSSEVVSFVTGNGSVSVGSGSGPAVSTPPSATD